MHAEKLAEAYREAETALADLRSRMRILSDTEAVIAFLDVSGPSPRVKFDRVSLTLGDLPMVVDVLLGWAAAQGDDEREGSLLRWTRQRPTIPGPYWLRIAGAVPDMVRVLCSGGVLRAIGWDFAEPIERLEALHEDDGPLEWFGPLGPPGRNAVARGAPASASWTSSPPSELGWYWFRPYRGDPAEPVPEAEAEMVKACDPGMANGGKLWIQRPEDKGSSSTIELMRGLWRGPLRPEVRLVWRDELEPRLRLSRKPPEEAGWYWGLLGGSPGPPRVYRLQMRDYSPHELEYSSGGAWQLVSKVPAMSWAGPIPYPLSEKEETDGEETQAEAG